MTLSLAASSPALAVRGRGLAQDGCGQKRKKTACGQKRKKTCCRKASAPADIDDSLDEGLWKMLPEEIFDLILERLPFAAQFRFRCLCRRWKGLQLLSPPPPCTIMSKAGDQNAVFWCNVERKWISLPSSRHVPYGRSWEVVDADAGLVCYQCNVDGCFWLWVCNPLKPSLSRLIRRGYERMDPRMCFPQAPQTKLLVDRASGTYKIIAKLDQQPGTAVYESTTSRWTLNQGSPCMSSLEFFVWRNVLFAYNTEKNLKKARFEKAPNWLNVFNMQKRRWIRVPVNIPSEVNFPTNRFFLSNNEHVMLVLYSYRKRYRPYFSVWKLLDDGSSSKRAPICKLENWEEDWEKIEIGSERAVVDLRGHRLARASYGGDYICFAFRDDNITLDGSRGCKCVRYSFAAKSWSEMPCPRDLGGNFGLYNWEPSLDVDPS